MKTVFSGLKPSGDMTIGNYLGAMKHWPTNQDSQRGIFFVPNLHAITVRQDPKLLLERTYDLIAWLLVCGIDPDTSVLLVQSLVPEHAELCWILDNYVTMGELSRMTQFKDKSRKLGNEGQLVGLFNYPVLMAADILLYDANEVPVGEDQMQHVELTRDIAKRFNSLYGDTFVMPKAVTPKVGSRIMSLDDPAVKMSKSAHEASYILLSDSPEAIRKKIKISVTDSENRVAYGPDKPGISNLLEIYAGFSDETVEEIEGRYQGKGYGELKADVAELLVQSLTELQERFRTIRGDQEKLEAIIFSGSQKARTIAGKKLSEVKQKVGLL